MYEIYAESILYKFLVFMPFVGIISNKLNPFYSYLVIVFFIVALLFFKINNQIVKFHLLILSLFFINLYVVFLYQLFKYDFSNAYYIQFFGSQLLFFTIFYFFVSPIKLYTRYLNLFFEYTLYFIFISVVIDFILVSNGMDSSQLMYKPDLLSYHGKALGLFGQFSINTTYSIVFYLFYLSFTQVTSIKKNVFLFILVTLVILLENSGTGYILYLTLIFTLFYKSLIFRLLIVPFAISAIFYIIQNNFIDKISFNYLSFTYYYFLEIFKVSYIDNIYSIYDFLFGIDGNYDFPIDFGPMFMIAKVGFLYFFFYSIVIFYMIFEAPNRYFRMAIVSLLIANIHYPALFYPVMNVLLPVLLIYLLRICNKTHEKNIIYIIHS
jgi:hypothetical protein